MIWKISTPFSTAAIAFSPICLTIRLRMLRPGQAEDRGQQLDDALEVERLRQLDAALGERPEQPAHQALAEVVEDVVLELEDAALDAVDQVAQEADRVLDDVADDAGHPGEHVRAASRRARGSC